MTTADLIKGLEAQIAEFSSRIDAALGEWQSASDEQRSAIEDRIKGLEDGIVELRSQIEEKSRESLPGCEPGADEGRSFSLARACRAIMTRDWDAAGFEKEVFDNMRQRAMSSGSDAAGGFIVPDEAIPQVIEKLKANVVAFQLGAREIPATGAPILIPRVGTSVTANWMTGENQTITASDLGLQQIELTPKSLAARTILSNQLMELSNPAADSIIEDDMASQLAIGLDKGILEGSGASGQPLGIINDANVLTEAISATITFTELVGFVDALAVANSLRGRLGWAMHPSTFTQLMLLKSENASAGTPSLDVGRHVVTESAPTSILGYPYATTTSFTTATGADCLVFGNWDDVLVAMWGGLRLRASDTSDDAFSKDQTHIRGIMRVDTALRHPESFCRAT